MSEQDKINIENFRCEIALRKLLEQRRKSTFTKEFPLEEIEALSIEGLQTEIDKILLKQDEDKED